MTHKRRRNKRQTIELEELKNDPNSFLALNVDDPVLHKLETYRLYQTDEYAVADIAEAFGFSHGYLYEMWEKFKMEGTEALVDKRWGAVPRKRTSEKESAVLRAKAINPYQGDSDLASKFNMDRKTIYELLKEHGLQDLHRVIVDPEKEDIEKTSAESKEDGGEKKGSRASPVSKHYS